MKSLLLLLLLSLSFTSFSQTFHSLLSPDKRIRITIHASSGLSYDVVVDSEAVISGAQMNMQLNRGAALNSNLAIQSVKTRSVNETITAQVPVSRKNIPDVYNELTLKLKNHFAVIFRAYNDGVAYRIATSFADSITVENETAKFSFAYPAHAYAPIIHQRNDADIYHTSFEELYLDKPLDSLRPADHMYSPVLVSTSGNLKVAVTESDLDDYPGMFLTGTSSPTLTASFAPYPVEERTAEGDYPQKIVTRRTDYIARTNGSRFFPWRVLMIAREDKDLPVNDLVYRLASPTRIADASWVHPGKGTDEWIIDINLFNVPFRSGINTATYKYYVDFAKRFGFNRIMMDAGWSNAKNLFDINPNINMDTLAAYARQQGIRLSMWTLSMTLNRQLDSALQQFQKWGVDFIMTDFTDRDDQPTVNFYKRVTEACAKAHMMIMFHGAYPQKGFNRTYPNNISREGVLGSEYNAWSDKVTASHDCILPFTRMLAGPLDYEPGLLDNATPKQFKAVWGKVMSQTNRCHQLALFLVYDTPLPIFSGNPSQGYLEPQFMELLGSLPSNPDTTVIVDAKVGQYIITARRYGSHWFLAGITDSAARDVRLPLSFLTAEHYTATVCKDGINADRNAMDYLIETMPLRRDSDITIHLAPNGGFLMRLNEVE